MIWRDTSGRRHVIFVRRRRRALLDPLASWTEQEVTRLRATAALVLATAAAVLALAAVVWLAAERIGLIAPAHPTEVLETVIVSPSPTPTPWPWP